MSSGVARTKTIFGHNMGALRTELYRISQDGSVYQPRLRLVYVYTIDRQTHYRRR